MSKQLKPCPFCGSPKTEAQRDDGLFWIKCLGCYSTGPATTKYSGAEDNFYRDWNTRTEDTALAAKDARIAELEAEIARLRESLMFACESLATITSSDGSGHADISVAALRLAGTQPVDREKLVNGWKANRAWSAQPARQEYVIDLDALAWESIKEAANNSPWMPEQYMLNDWVSDVCAFLREPDRQVGGDEREQFIVWATENFPNAYTGEAAEHYWDKGHVSALAWKARAELAPAAVVVPKTEIWQCRNTENSNIVDLPYRPQGPWDCVEYVRRDEVARLNRRAIPVEVLNLARQWFNAIQDSTNASYLEQADRDAYAKILSSLGWTSAPLGKSDG